MKTFRRLALTTTLTTIVLVGVGGLVRATGSGLGCPRWPKCFGRWIPPMRAHALIEWSHRFTALVAILLLVTTAVVALAKAREKRILVPTMLATFMIFVQAGLGAIVVNTKNSPSLVTLHIGTAMALVGLLVWMTVAAFRPAREHAPGGASARGAGTELGAGGAGDARGFARLAFASAAAVYALILVGAYVRGQGAGLAFPDWPLMNHRVVPALGGPATTQFAHRVAALVVGALLATLAVRAATKSRALDRTARTFAFASLGLFLAQAIVGGLQVLTKLNAAPVTLHVLLSASLWACAVATVALARAPRAGEATVAVAETVTASETATAAAETAENKRPARRDSVRAYVALTKPRIVLLLVVTTVPTMILAARGIPSIGLMVATVFGGALAAGAANAINMFFDRDIDEIMGRTKRRPLPAHSVAPARAIAFACLLAALSFWFMTATVNLLAATLTQGALLFYVFVYTLGLKRTTPQNIVIGGAAGAVPVLVGWAAVTGRVGIEAYILFCVVFFWTPPHFWALAMRFERDYASAGVPMLPVVSGARETQRQILLYSFVTVAVTLALWPVAHMGATYLAAAGLLGALFVRYAVNLWRRGTPKDAMALFKYSITYLALLFAAVGVDAAVRAKA
jgi:protoheme IX farnesyltransferase